jgi:hypothetical protein
MPRVATNPSAQLNPSTARRVLDADLANLLAKVRSGRPLSRFERQIVEAHADGSPTTGPAYAQSYNQLAAALGVSRQSIAYHARNPDAPQAAQDGRHDVGAWRRYLSDRSRLLAGDGPVPEGETRERIKNLALKNARLEFALHVSQGNFIPRALARSVLSQFVVAAKTRSLAGVDRLATLVRLAEDHTRAAEIIREEMVSLWSEMETSDWYHPPTATAPAPTATPVDQDAEP